MNSYRQRPERPADGRHNAAVRRGGLRDGLGGQLPQHAHLYAGRR